MVAVGELKEQAEGRLAAARRRSPLLDRAVRTVLHYNRVGGSRLAGSVTYFGFLSVFPLLALAYFVVGRVAVVYPEARRDLRSAIEAVLPGLVGDDAGQLSLRSFEESQTALSLVGLLGLVGVLYTGLGWLSGSASRCRTPSKSPPTSASASSGARCATCSPWRPSARCCS